MSDARDDQNEADLYLAGEMAPPGDYRRFGCDRVVHLSQEDYLPASLDGQVAVYARKHTWREIPQVADQDLVALGVEEQRVNVVLDLTGDTANLADAYRVEVRVITWQAPDVLKVPSSALFRAGEQWAVFRVSNGVVQRTILKMGSETYPVSVCDCRPGPLRM